MTKEVNMNHKVKKSDGDMKYNQGQNFKKDNKKSIKKEFLPTDKDQLKEFLINLMGCGAHFGHPSTHPTCATLAIGKTNGCNIIDLSYLIKALGEVLNKIYNVISNGGKILLVNTSGASELFKKIALETGQAFITNNRYRPGFFTNFVQFKKQITSVIRLQQQLDSDIFTKKEKKVIKKTMEKDQIYFSGLGALKEMPKMVIVIGDSKEYEILKKETLKTGTYFVSLSDVNVEHLKTGQQISIPCNTSSQETLNFIIGYFAQAILAGYESYLQNHSQELEEQNGNTPIMRKKSQEDMEQNMLDTILDNKTSTNSTNSTNT